MFVPDFQKSIPGYTGHKRQEIAQETDQQQPKDPRKFIPGKSQLYMVTDLFLCNQDMEDTCQV